MNGAGSTVARIGEKRHRGKRDRGWELQGKHVEEVGLLFQLV